MRGSRCADGRRSGGRDRAGLARALAIAMLPLVAAPCGAQTAADTLFRFPVGGAVTAGPAIADGRAWLLSDAKTLYILTVDGVAIGKRAMTERRSAFLACDDYGRAAVSEGATGLALVNKAGQEVWRVELGSAPESAPAFAPDGRLFVVTAGALSAFAPNGRRLWSAALPSRPSSPLVIGPGGGPALGLADGSALLFSADGGAPNSAPLGATAAALASSPLGLAAALEDGRIVAPLFGSGVAGDEAGESAGRGEAARLGSRPLALVGSEDGFYALGADGALLAVDGRGRELWRASVPLGQGPTALAAFEGKVIVMTRSAVRSYGSDGSIYRTLLLSNATSLPAVAPNGTVFAGGADWVLYAYRFERPLSIVPRPTIAALDLEAVDAVAKEESLWALAPYDDNAAMERLYDIEKSLKSGTIGTETRRSSLYAAAVALGRLDSPFGSGPSRAGPTPSGPLPRVYACGLLGRMGLPQAVPALVEVFERDPEPAVKAAAASAVAAIGLDPTGGALAAFARASERRLDERTAGAIVDAIDGLYRASGALDERSGILALARISGGDYPRDLRAKAEKALARVTRAR